MHATNPSESWTHNPLVMSVGRAPERMFCTHGLTYAYCSSGRSYSAIRNSRGQLAQRGLTNTRTR